MHWKIYIDYINYINENSNYTTVYPESSDTDISGLVLTYNFDNSTAGDGNKNTFMDNNEDNDLKADDS